ncbi:2OG-Fe dioxygenase domain-containing protein [Cordyceps javanica]|nr:2OG-Fe dioxygenase domain-containing protein [Cordyceps javanica]
MRKLKRACAAKWCQTNSPVPTSEAVVTRNNLHSDGQKRRRAAMPSPRGHHRDGSDDVFVHGSAAPSKGSPPSSEGWIPKLNTAACCYQDEHYEGRV